MLSRLPKCDQVPETWLEVLAYLCCDANPMAYRIARVTNLAFPNS